MIRLTLLLAGACATLAAALVYAEPAQLAKASALVQAVLDPNPATSHTRVRTVEVRRARNGDFALRARVNGARTPMVMDTGASAVILTFEDARAAGLPTEFLDYSVTIDTANGKTRAASVVLDKIAVGDLSEQSIPALIVEPGKLKVSLLGMTFLDRLHSFEVRGDRIELRGYP